MLRSRPPLLTRVNGSVDGSNQAMNGKAARQVVARDATTLAASSASAALAAAARLACDASATALAASGELSDEFLQKVNGDLKAWHGDKLTHGVGVISAGSNVGAWQSAEGELGTIGAATSSNRHGLNTNLTVASSA